MFPLFYDIYQNTRATSFNCVHPDFHKSLDSKLHAFKFVLNYCTENYCTYHYPILVSIPQSRPLQKYTNYICYAKMAHSHKRSSGDIYASEINSF